MVEVLRVTPAVITVTQFRAPLKPGLHVSQDLSDAGSSIGQRSGTLFNVRRLVAASASLAAGRAAFRQGCGRKRFPLVQRNALETGALVERPWEAPGYRGAVVSAMSDGMQAAVFTLVFAALIACTYACCATLGQVVANFVPSFITSTGAALLGLIWIAGGAAHFAAHQDYCNIMPHQGAWGLWLLPGSASFYVYLTGVAEILGGASLLLAVLPFETPDWLGPLAAEALFVLTVAITPANLYSATHNAPGPGPPADGDLQPLVSPSGHAGRFLAQVLLLTSLWEIAHPY